MIITKVEELRGLLGQVTPKYIQNKTKIVLVDPEFFRVEYAINPFMKNSSGELRKIDIELARQQWNQLKTMYMDLGFDVSVIEGQPELPDMVFAANQSFPFISRQTGRKTVLLSQMAIYERKPEVEQFRRWYDYQGYDVLELNDPSLCLEGNGDVLGHPELPIIFGGVGSRTDIESYQEIVERFGFSIIPLRPQMQEFYHLDTCFSILDKNTVALVPQAFLENDLKLISTVFDRVINIDVNEALECFAANCHCPDGKNVILNKGSDKFVSQLEIHGFKVHELDTSEFIKAGGSVFCMKMNAY